MVVRRYWVEMLYQVVKPVFSALAEGQLKATMPVETAHPRPRDHVSHLEAFGRALAGVAPWLATSGLDEEEAALRDEVLGWARQGLRMACDPKSPDYMSFAGTSGDDNRQPLVDAAFLAHGILRAMPVLWPGLDTETQGLVIKAVKQCRVIVPNYNNWLLFAAMIETFLYSIGSDSDYLRIDVALRQHEAWYLGDGMYGDGPLFHWDYYNSYVIQPMLLDIVETMAGINPVWDKLSEDIRMRARRYAAVQERLIAPDGSFPVIGRSICYRNGAFQLLAQMALRDDLPPDLTHAQVRGALTAVIRRTLGAPGTFDSAGWLTLGLAGHQPGLAESYISTGSLYLCTVGFLPLGLPPEHPFWTSAAAAWTSQRIWAGDDMKADKAFDRNIVD
ncbi:MAG TPA: DUF2264 domain-containing protein [Aggregatilineaceae bacterium]|nr:DUF2264 domain-containing protein [Aggregatilineaceae bacterium]